MYYIFDFLQLRKKLIRTLGTLQFDNLDADTIINDLERAIVGIIKKEFDEIEFSKLSCLVDDDTPYHKFYEKINENENKELFEKFMLVKGTNIINEPINNNKLRFRTDLCIIFFKQLKYN